MITGDVKGNAFLIDLPRFSFDTLNNIDELTLVLSEKENGTVVSEWESAFSIASVMKKRGYPW